MIVENRFRFDGRIVADGHGAIRFARANGGRSFSDSQNSADALVRDASVRAFEIVTDADVAQDVVGKILQQPHRVHHRAELAPKRLQVAGRRCERREEIVITSVNPAARAGEDSAPIVEASSGLRVQRLAMRQQAGLLNRDIGGIEAKQGSS